MTKAVTQEGFYHCEGKFDFSQSREGETEKESPEELVEEMEIDKEEEPSLSTEESKKPLNREGEGFGIKGKG